MTNQTKATTPVSQEFIAEIREAIYKTLKQGKRCVNEDNTCVYDDGKGNHCLVGHMMTPEELAEYGDHAGGIHSLVEKQGWRKDKYSPTEVTILELLQTCHDESKLRFAEEFKPSLRTVHISDRDYEPLVRWAIEEAITKYEAEVDSNNQH